MNSSDDEIDLLISKILFDQLRYTIAKNDFDLFRNIIHQTSTLMIRNPREIQEEISFRMFKNSGLTIHYTDIETIEKRREEIWHFNYMLKYQTTRDFSSVKVLKSSYEIFEKNVENFKKMSEDLEKKNNIDLELEKTKKPYNFHKDQYPFTINKQFDRLYISLKLHLMFYRIGAFIIFSGNQKSINSAQYLNELWTHTSPDDADGKIGNETPIIFDPLWLTYIHLYGGQNLRKWTKTFYGISLNYDDFHGAEIYLYKYYLLTITQCIQKAHQGSNEFKLPLINEIDNPLKFEKNIRNELYHFSEDFLNESGLLLKYCDEMIEDSREWNPLFNDQARDLFILTRKWISETVSQCKKFLAQKGNRN